MTDLEWTCPDCGEVLDDDGHEKEETDKWGRFVTATTFPKLPRRVERLYERLKAGHDAPPLSA
jgi:ssDNA-binding Zn-finger/Zn-ribbon topoisomerase 1